MSFDLSPYAHVWNDGCASCIGEPIPLVFALEAIQLVGSWSQFTWVRLSWTDKINAENENTASRDTIPGYPEKS